MSPVPARRAWLVWLGLALAIAGGVVLRVVAMQPVGLWTDECVTFWTASPDSWAEVCRRSLGYTTHTPPFYLVVNDVKQEGKPKKVKLNHGDSMAVMQLVTGG